MKLINSINIQSQAEIKHREGICLVIMFLKLQEKLTCANLARVTQLMTVEAYHTTNVDAQGQVWEGERRVAVFEYVTWQLWNVLRSLNRLRSKCCCWKENKLFSKSLLLC